ncbi:MAG: alginate lyase family protein [Thermoleophilia bacterium]
MGWYRIAVRTGYFRRRLPKGPPYSGPFFGEPRLTGAPDGYAFDAEQVVAAVDGLLAGNLRFFGSVEHSVGSPPSWFLDPYTGASGDSHAHWSDISDFDSGVGDIKAVWEASRFGWAPTMARAYRLTGRREFADSLEAWISDWVRKNPANTGPNWKCGQETSIRMLHALLAGVLLGRERDPEPALVRFVIEHCRRVEPTLSYALAQDNNHGVSEALALFVGGAWLEAAADGAGGPLAKAEERRKWEREGWRWLEERVQTLVQKDGSFSQHSVTYHRLLLDSLCMAEWWRAKLGRPAFSPVFLDRARAAADWLYQMVEPGSGDAPNLGANDGVHVFAFDQGAYRDFRPSVQRAMSMFHGCAAYPPGPWDESLTWLGVSPLTRPAPPRSSRVFPDGRYVTLVPAMARDMEPEARAWGLVRFPGFKHRPSHADAFHLDLWVGSVNLLRDGGSYSYAAGDPWQRFFPGTQSHNTVQFDGRDQMPRLGRFLFADWLETDQAAEIVAAAREVSWEGEYTDGRGARHARSVTLAAASCTVVDRLSGDFDKAVIRWRLAPGRWDLRGVMCVGEAASVEICSDPPIANLKLITAWESRYYLEKSPLPVFEAEIGEGPCVIRTVIRF